MEWVGELDSDENILPFSRKWRALVSQQLSRSDVSRGVDQKQ